jgi:hypothetical protein
MKLEALPFALDSGDTRLKQLLDMTVGHFIAYE